MQGQDTQVYSKCGENSSGNFRGLLWKYSENDMHTKAGFKDIS